MKLAIIGGCGSSGTTLLAHLLSKHHEVVSGPEMKFFNHPDAMSLTALRAHHDALFDRHRLPDGYHAVPTFLRAGLEFGIDRKVFAGWLAESGELRDVYDSFTRHMCEVSGASVFIEKTPSNVYNFSALALRFPDIPLIHQIRDGRDVVASFRGRGKSLFQAASLWLYDTVCGIRLRGSTNYLEARYEDLVFEPEKALGQILSRVGLDFAPHMLEVDSAATEGTYQEQWLDRKTPRTWKQLPSQPVSPASVGRYREKLSAEDLSTIYRVRLTDRVREATQSPVASFGELLELLGYAGEGERPGLASASRRIVERGCELRDFAARTPTCLRYKRRFPQRFTRITAQGSGS